MPSFRCDLRPRGTPLAHVWEHTVGSGHATLALRADWQAQLARCRRELGVRRVRFHGVLCDDMGTLIEQGGELIYSFFNADQIVDFLLALDVRPFVELSFMPTALASGADTVFHYRGNVTPPRDYEQWAALVGRLAAHWVERYGAGEVREWLFECWNEPNIQSFWTGTRDDYFRLYEHTARALKAVDPGLRIGGPATAKNEWIDDFLTFCHRRTVPVDFVTTHHYPTDAPGDAGDDTDAQLAAARRGQLRDEAERARREARDRPLYYTEWSTSSNPFHHRHDEPYAAAFVVKAALDVAGTVDGYSYWTFSDLFEENYLSSTPFHGGFGLLTIHGVAKPTYRAFELLHRLGTERLVVDGLHTSVNAWVVRDGHAVTALLSNHALPGHPIITEKVRLCLIGGGTPRTACVERIDAEHANARALWHQLGQPEYLSASQLDQLHRASELVAEPQRWRPEGDGITFELDLPEHAVAALTVVFDPRSSPLPGPSSSVPAGELEP